MPTQTFLCCQCCWFWLWGTWWQQFGRNFEAEDCSRYQGEIWSRFWSYNSVQLLKLKFGQDFEADVWSRFWSLFVVNTLRLRIGQAFEAEVILRFWSWILVFVVWIKNSYFGESIQPLGLLCLWQCLSPPCDLGLVWDIHPVIPRLFCLNLFLKWNTLAMMGWYHLVTTLGVAV